MKFRRLQSKDKENSFLILERKKFILNLLLLNYITEGSSNFDPTNALYNLITVLTSIKLHEFLRIKLQFLKTSEVVFLICSENKKIIQKSRPDL